MSNIVNPNGYTTMGISDYPGDQAEPHGYAMNDMGSVYTHYDPKVGKNVPTPNKLKGGNKNGTGSK